MKTQPWEYVMIALFYGLLALLGILLTLKNHGL
jgi:hypothetical protein